MKKVRKYKRKDRAGYWIEWRENGRRKCKQVNTKTEQNHFANLIYRQINSDVYTSIDLPFRDAAAEYLETFEVRGLAAGSKYEADRFLRLFNEISAPSISRSISQKVVDQFILRRRRQTKSGYTLNKDIRRMHAFLAWMKKRGYHPGGIDLSLVPVPPLVRRAITDDDIRRLITAATSDAWRVRILISLFTGWRKNDVDRLRIADVDLERLTIAVVQQKTYKAAVKPIPDAAMVIVRRYVESRPGGDVRLFADVGVRRAWDKLRTAAGLFKLDPAVRVITSGRRKPEARKNWTILRQDLRRTYATLIETTRPMFGASDALQHSARSVTDNHYLDRMAVDRWQVNQLPIAKWLEPISV